MEKKAIKLTNSVWLNTVSSASTHMMIVLSNSSHQIDDTSQILCFVTTEIILSVARWLSETWSNACSQTLFIWVTIY